MRGSGNNGKNWQRTERKLEEALESVVISNAGAKDRETAEMESWAPAKCIARVDHNIAHLYAVAKEWRKAGYRKRYSVLVEIGDEGISDRLVGCLEAPGLPAEEEEKSSSPSGPPAYIPFSGSHIMLEIGYHVSISGGMDLAFDRAAMIGCTAMQVFLGNPRGWGSKALTDEETWEFRAKLRRFGASRVFAHMAYLPNIASPNEFAYGKSVEALNFSLRRCNRLGIRYLVTHLGSHLGEGKDVGLRRAVRAMAQAKAAIGDVTLLLENEAGQRNSIGSKVEDLAELRAMIHDAAPGMAVGFCMDTCHLYAAGYDVGSRGALSGIFKVINPNDVRVIHLNDARYPLGSALDRHENIGRGCIGREGFRTFLNHPAVKGKPMIMETPSRSLEEDRAQIRLVRSLAGKKA